MDRALRWGERKIPEKLKKKENKMLEEIFLKSLPTLGASLPLFAILFIAVKNLAHQLLKQTECHITDLKDIQKNTILIVSENTAVITKLSILIEELLRKKS